VRKLVYEYPYKHPYGFTRDEINKLIASVPEIKLNMKEFENAFFGITVMLADNKEHIYYPQDVHKAFDWGMGNKLKFL
jgi:hypothetical protein